MNCDSKGSISLTNCLSLLILQPFVDRRDRLALSASCKVQIEIINVSVLVSISSSSSFSKALILFLVSAAFFSQSSFSALRAFSSLCNEAIMF